MNELFKALLDISKLDAGSVEPDIAAFPIDPLLRRIETCSRRTHTRNSASAHPAQRRSVRSDHALLERILLNVVSNAVRYTAAAAFWWATPPRRRAANEVAGHRHRHPGRSTAKRLPRIPSGRRCTPRGRGQARPRPRPRHRGSAVPPLEHPLGAASTLGKGSRFSITSRGRPRGSSRPKFRIGCRP